MTLTTQPNDVCRTILGLCAPSLCLHDIVRSLANKGHMTAFHSIRPAEANGRFLLPVPSRGANNAVGIGTSVRGCNNVRNVHAIPSVHHTTLCVLS